MHGATIKRVLASSLFWDFTWICSLLPKFWDFLGEGFTPEDGTDRLSRNVANYSTLRKVCNVSLSLSSVKRTSSWNLLVLLATLRMNATGLCETSVNSDPMTQLHMPGRHSPRIQRCEKKPSLQPWCYALIFTVCKIWMLVIFKMSAVLNVTTFELVTSETGT
jgi:hypothetical protein